MALIWAALVIAIVVSGIHGEEITVCEGKSLEIKCLGNQKIHITAADFGRSEKEVCKTFFLENDRNTNCHTQAALDITRKECEGFTSCTVYAYTKEYGDPCLFVKKYLTVSYKCVTARANVLHQTRVCEGHQQSITCPPKRKIDIEYANYGRLKGIHGGCGFIVFNDDCGAEKSLSTVQSDCQGKPTCVLEANNKKFGDPCWFTQKYLEVHYRCRLRVKD